MHLYFVYVSFAFLAVALYRADYLVVPPVDSPAMLGASVVLLYMGFIADALSWRKLLGAHRIRISLSCSIASTGLAIFGKYIPGKLWVIVGRAAYVAERCRQPMGPLTVASMQAQIMVILVGLVPGLGLALIVEDLRRFATPLGLALLGFALVLFHPLANTFATRVMKKLTRGSGQAVPRLGIGAAVRLVPWFVATWLLWSAAFYCLALALNAAATPLAALAFPLAATLGILAVVVPGGLGVREGVLAACLVTTGLPLVEATSISVAARLWFLLGETGLFVTAAWLNARR